ncbi:hypothetical protein [Rhodoplanes sp. Z2-YC6860]|uniref:hypothetical protein n=1 Tax=Rhodoplanes sp. Z2-YC6860 TaxID=674703 RepID=UPI00078B70F8|nr:triple helix repeat-containing collagen [Rhodoplanes sp. Z2-YC6860]
MQGPRGEPGPQGALPSIEQVMPWLHLIFEAWEDYKAQRDLERIRQEEAERQQALEAAQEAAAAEAVADDQDDGEKKKHKKKKNKKKHKDERD